MYRRMEPAGCEQTVGLGVVGGNPSILYHWFLAPGAALAQR